MSKRQQAIIDALENVKTTCDVGCDHGYLSLEMLLQGKTQFVVASDISQKCLQKTINLLKKYPNFEKNVNFACVDGIPQEMDFEQVLIAGMGGCEIIKILQNSKNKPKFLVLQPMNRVNILRNFLQDFGYKISLDRVIQDKKFYHILKAEIGYQTLTDYQVNFGAIYQNYREPDYLLWLERKLNKLQKILKNLQKNDKKYETIANCIENINNFKENLNND